MERRIIQVQNVSDQAGITAALRRAFSERAPATPNADSDEDSFVRLLKQIH